MIPFLCITWSFANDLERYSSANKPLRMNNWKKTKKTKRKCKTQLLILFACTKPNSWAVRSKIQHFGCFAKKFNLIVLESLEWEEEKKEIKTNSSISFSFIWRYLLSTIGAWLMPMTRCCRQVPLAAPLGNWCTTYYRVFCNRHCFLNSSFFEINSSLYNMTLINISLLITNIQFLEFTWTFKAIKSRKFL